MYVNYIAFSSLFVNIISPFYGKSAYTLFSMSISLVTVLIAFVAGAATALSPCVLPILPVVLGTGINGGRRRPLGIITGLVITFTITIGGLSAAIISLGFPNELLRYIAIATLSIMGMALLIPAWEEWLTKPLNRLSRLGPKKAGDGFLSGLPVGVALGFVYAPCAGPILAAVIATAAVGGTSAQVIIVAASYGIGSGISLLALSLGGRKLIGRFSDKTIIIQRVTGSVMLLFAIALSFNADVRFQQTIAERLPAWVINPTKNLEASQSNRLESLGENKQKFSNKNASSLQRLGKAPEIQGITKWFNSPALTQKGLVQKNRVTLIDFWTYTCINCLRTIPQIKAWDEKYRKLGLSVIGVHTPEFAFERKDNNIAAAIKKLGIKYPVANDREYGTWNAYGNQYWPAEYLIDSTGEVRYVHFGEGDDKKTEAAIRSLLTEKGAKLNKVSTTDTQLEIASGTNITAETYLGLKRRAGFNNTKKKTSKVTTYKLQKPSKTGELSFGGQWTSSPESATAGRNARLAIRAQAQDVFLVMKGTGTVGINIKGAVAGDDVKNGKIILDGQRLYRIAHADKQSVIDITLHFTKGQSAYAFTFG